MDALVTKYRYVIGALGAAFFAFNCEYPVVSDKLMCGILAGLASLGLYSGPTAGKPGTGGKS